MHRRATGTPADVSILSQSCTEDMSVIQQGFDAE
jgi:hypothetical protein